MVHNLVIVESPNKIKTLQKILGPNYIIVASYGHVYTLPKHSLSIDIENNFEPKYAPDPDKKNAITGIKTALKQLDSKSIIYLAQDKDREGEGIAQGIIDLFKLKNYKRIVFTSITKKDVLFAVAKPIELNKNLVYAQMARRLLDRIVGYKLSPILWKNIQNPTALSAGRVQSPIVKLIVDRENEIKLFFENDDSCYYNIKSYFNSSLTCSVHHLSSEPKLEMYKGPIVKCDKDEVIKIFNKCNKSIFKIKYKFDKITEKTPPQPFMTSTLQQEAYNKFNMSTIVSMQIAQNLYSKGYITYLRTDSVSISEEGQENIKEYIVNNYSEKYYLERQFESNVKNAQEAHEAVRPTHIENVHIDENEYEQKLYSLIWKRTVASQMANAQIGTNIMQISISKLLNYYMQCTWEQVIFDGFLKIYKEDASINTNLEYNINDILKLDKMVGKLEYQKPVGRYNYASIGNTMKQLGIGRPATWAQIIENILKKGYIKCSNVEGVVKEGNILTLENNEIIDEDVPVILGQEKNRFVPTNIGYSIVDFLNKHFKDTIMDYDFTSQMEKQCDDIANGNLLWTDSLRTFYNIIKPKIDILNVNKFSNGSIIGKCPITGLDIEHIISKKGNYVKMGNKMAPIIVDNKDCLLEAAIQLLKYPYIFCQYNDLPVEIKYNSKTNNIYLCWNNKCTSIGKYLEEELTETIVTKLIESNQNKIIKEFEQGKKKYTILNGEYGPYINIKSAKKSKNIKIPKSYVPQDITMDIIKVIETKYKKK